MKESLWKRTQQHDQSSQIDRVIVEQTLASEKKKKSKTVGLRELQTGDQVAMLTV